MLGAVYPELARAIDPNTPSLNESALAAPGGAAYGPVGPAVAPDGRVMKITVPIYIYIYIYIYTTSVKDVRDYFPETWLFQLQTTGSNGVFMSKETLSDTVTEWEGSAVCINPKEGLGLSNVTSIKGFQAFFISYNLPISVIRGEFTVVVSIFNYVDNALPNNAQSCSNVAKTFTPSTESKVAKGPLSPLAFVLCSFPPTA
ncbi:alpha-1-inhibitor 3 [Trichonephila inaurata madagascariensis]|uniref:Alpha-1-inhibitor 3 n=1 Tax=Trichonephila inaurata madagascariensis TaxID=2747483 RepID=A0A8X6YDN8_9ARAC|nr:alpha-1-inhibitor 3 [Trichonephila inaurata madagascariensis]